MAVSNPTAPSAAPTFGGLSSHAISDASFGDVAVWAPQRVPQNAVMLALIQSDTTMFAVPTGWTLLDSNTSGVFTNCYVYSKTAGANEPISWVWQLNAAGKNAGWAFSWWTSAGGIDQHAIAHATASPTVTTTAAGDRIVTIVGLDLAGHGGLTIDAACTEVSIDGNTPGTATVYDTTNQAAAGVTTARNFVSTPTANRTYLATVALKP